MESVYMFVNLILCICDLVDYCFSSMRRHTRCALVTVVQTCALLICIICETTSGGVEIAPTTNGPTSTYWRLLASCLGVTKPVLTSSTSATGVSNAKPKATKIVSTKSRYLLMSVITATPSGATVTMK